MLPTVLLLIAGLAGEPSPAPKAIAFDAALGLTNRTPKIVGPAEAAREKAAQDQNISSVPYNPQVSVMPGWRFAPKAQQQTELVVEVVQPWNLSGRSRATVVVGGLVTSTLLTLVILPSLYPRLYAIGPRSHHVD